MNPSKWMKRLLRFRNGRDGHVPALHAVFESESGSDERLSLLEEIVSRPHGADDLRALADLRRRETALLSGIEDLSLSDADMKQLRRTAGAEIRDLKSTRRIRWKPALILAPAAAAVLLAVFALNSFRGSDPVPAVERAGSAAAFATLAPSGDAARSRLEFQWARVKGAKHYRLEIFDAELSVLFRKDMIEGQAFRLPRETASRLETGERFFWRVTVFLESGARLESGFDKFRISGK